MNEENIIIEKPKDRPTCINCKKQLSPQGGSLDGSTMYWGCWDCGYKVEDIPCIELPISSTSQ